MTLRASRSALVAIAIAILAASCATDSGRTDGDTASITRELTTLLIPRQWPENSLVYDGVTVHLPPEFRFLSAWGTVSEGAPPAGILFRFANNSSELSGTVQAVPVATTDGADPTTMEDFLRRYHEAILPHHRAIAIVAGVPAERTAVMISQDEGSPIESLVAVRFFADRSVPTAILLEIRYPPSEQNRTTAASIASTLQVPETTTAAMEHRRKFAETLSPQVHSLDGSWRWVTDLPGGFIVRSDRFASTVFVAYVEQNSTLVPSPEIVPGVAVTLKRGDWVWEAPLFTAAETPDAFGILIPPDPDFLSTAEQIGRALVLHLPDRTFQDGRIIAAEPMLPQDAQEILQNFLDTAFTVH